MTLNSLYNIIEFLNVTLFVCKSLIFFEQRVKKYFETHAIQVQKRPIDEAALVVRTFFTCPACGAEYTVLVSDPEVTRLINSGKKSEAADRVYMLRLKYLGLAN